MKTTIEIRELIANGRIKSKMITMGERIAWGSDTATIDELADVTEQLLEENERLKEELKYHD